MGHNLFYIIHIVVGVLLMHQSFLEMFLLSIRHMVFRGLLNITTLIGVVSSPYLYGRYYSWFPWQPRN